MHDTIGPLAPLMLLNKTTTLSPIAVTLECLKGVGFRILFPTMNVGLVTQTYIGNDGIEKRRSRTRRLTV